MKVALTRNWVAQACLIASLLFTSVSCRIDADHFSQGNTISKNDYTVLPDQKTMTVIQFPMIDNSRERQLVYDKATASGYYAPPHF